MFAYVRPARIIAMIPARFPAAIPCAAGPTTSAAATAPATVPDVLAGQGGLPTAAAGEVADAARHVPLTEVHVRHQRVRGRVLEGQGEIDLRVVGDDLRREPCGPSLEDRRRLLGADQSCREPRGVVT